MNVAFKLINLTGFASDEQDANGFGGAVGVESPRSPKNGQMTRQQAQDLIARIPGYEVPEWLEPPVDLSCPTCREIPTSPENPCPECGAGLPESELHETVS